MFELATLGANYGLQTVNEIITLCPKVALRCFVALTAKRFLVVIDTLVFFSANLAFSWCFVKDRDNFQTADKMKADIRDEIFKLLTEMCRGILEN